MTRRARRLAWSLAKAEHRGHGPRGQWRADHRASWASYRVSGQGHGARIPPSAALLRRRARAARRRRWPTRKGRKL